jgi:hypothetical protein
MNISLKNLSFKQNFFKIIFILLIMLLIIAPNYSNTKPLSQKQYIEEETQDIFQENNFIYKQIIPIGWKIYTNIKNSYSISYPKNWYLSENNPNTPAIAIKHTIQHTDFSPVKNYWYYKINAFFMSVVVWDNSNQLCIQAWLKNENINHPVLILGKTIIVDNKKAIKYEPKGNAYYIDIWLTNGNKTYQLFYCEPSEKGEYLMIFKKMLSTFTTQIE